MQYACVSDLQPENFFPFVSERRTNDTNFQIKYQLVVNLNPLWFPILKKVRVHQFCNILFGLFRQIEVFLRCDIAHEQDIHVVKMVKFAEQIHPTYKFRLLK